MSIQLAPLLTEIKVNMTNFKKGMNEVVDSANKAAKEAGESFKKMGESMRGVGETMTASVTAPILALGAVAINESNKVQQSFGQIQAQLGLTKEDAEALHETAKNLFKNAFGEDLKDATTGLTTVKSVMKDLDGKELEKATERAFVLRDAFGVEINEGVKSADSLMKTFGISSEEAFDMITNGYQNGLNKADDFNDTLWEYSNLFNEYGFQADGFFNILSSGMEAGAFNTDKIADSIKEFGIRVQEGGVATEEAMGQLSASTQKVWQDFLSGKGTVKDVFDAVMPELAGMDNQVQANQIGVGLFGTMWEDLGPTVMTSLTTAGTSLDEMKGKTDAAGNALYDNFGTRLTSAFREAQLAMEPAGNVLADIAERVLPVLVNAITSVSEWFSNLSGTSQNVILTIVGLIAVIGPLLIFIGQVAIGIGSLISFFTTVGTVIMTATGATTAFGAVMAIVTSPITLVIAAIAAVIAIGVLLYKNWDTVSQKAREVWSFVSNITSQTWQSVSSSVSNAWNSMTSSISNGIANAKNKVTEMKNSIVNTIKSINLFQAGADIIRGLINGIGSMMSAAINKVKEVGRSITSGIKSVLGIKSPSRVFQDEVGKMIPEGLAIGIEKNVGMVEDASQTMVNATMPQELPYGSPQVTTTTTNATTTNNAPVNIYLDYKGMGTMDDAQNFAEMVDQALGQRLVNQNMFVGAR